MRNAYKLLVGKPDWERPLERLERERILLKWIL
jgi:hypothetical protein